MAITQAITPLSTYRSLNARYTIRLVERENVSRQETRGAGKIRSPSSRYHHRNVAGQIHSKVRNVVDRSARDSEGKNFDKPVTNTDPNHLKNLNTDSAGRESPDSYPRTVQLPHFYVLRICKTFQERLASYAITSPNSQKSLNKG